MIDSRWAIGDWMVYRKSKESPAPGPRARNVSPAKHGDTYRYTVDKYWVVVDVFSSEDAILLQTNRGKQHKISVHDPCLRKANWWERMFLRNRFLQIEDSIKAGSISTESRNG